MRVFFTPLKITQGNMLTKLIVALYVWWIEIALWLMLILAGVLGYHVTVPIMNAAGLILANEFAWKIVGALVFPPVAFLFFVVTIGPLLILVDVRNAVRNIEAKLEQGKDVSEPLPFRDREPFF